MPIEGLVDRSARRRRDLRIASAQASLSFDIVVSGAGRSFAGSWRGAKGHPEREYLASEHATDDRRISVQDLDGMLLGFRTQQNDPKAGRIRLLGPAGKNDDPFVSQIGEISEMPVD